MDGEAAEEGVSEVRRAESISGRRLRTITSSDSITFKKLKKLSRSARERKKLGLALLEGRRMLETYCRKHGSPATIIMGASFKKGEDCRAVVADGPRSEIIVLSDSLCRNLSGLKNSPGVFAVVETRKRDPEPEGEDSLLLDGIQDPGNLGTILRSAAATGVGTVHLSDSCADAWSPKVLRSGMGGHFYLRIEEASDLAAVARKFEGKVLVLDHCGDRSIYGTDLTGRLAIVVGSEGLGVAPAVRREAGGTAFIPMPGWREPVNVAVATSVCLFEVVRQRARHFS